MAYTVGKQCVKLVVNGQF